MRILWVATKPPAPPGDGGRLVALTTLRALAAAGHEVTIVAPVAPGSAAAARRAAAAAGLAAIELVPCTPRPWPLAAALGLVGGMPVTIARHGHAAIAARVDRLLATGAFDVVHAEQVQAIPACRSAAAHGVPVVLRAQNVESELWETRAARGARLLHYEARRLARFEGAAVRHAAATVALTARDAARLVALAGNAARVHHLPAPFPADGLTTGAAVAGAPAVVLPGSTGWPPNDDAAAWFTGTVWPLVTARHPGARLHRFATRAARGADRTITVHPPPAESADLFPAGAIVVVPLRAPIGVRMRILEAWARGLPVVATPAAVAGLDGEAERAVRLASDAAALADAIAGLAADPDAVRSVVAAGAALLRRRHDPATIAAALVEVYRDAAVGSAARART